MLDPKVIRRRILTMAYKGQTAHVACAFSIVEILIAVLDQMNFNPNDPNRDYLVLSKGHGVMALYACMRELGYLDQADLDNYMQDGSRLHGLASPTLPGIDTTTGSLGHGLPIAVGIALGLKLAGKPQEVYCIVGDGEMQEGSSLEALNFAKNNDLTNLTLIIDSNKFQAMGRTSDICHQDFGYGVNGHDIEDLQEDLKKNWPFFKLINARTAKGMGVSFMKGENSWHYKRLDASTYEKAMAELA